MSYGVTDQVTVELRQERGCKGVYRHQLTSPIHTELACMHDKLQHARMQHRLGIGTMTIILVNISSMPESKL